MKVTKKDAVVFKDIPETFEAARYHSWIATSKTLPDDLEVTATDENGQIMALQHKKYNVSAVQFHPESILTPLGEKIVRNFIENSKQ